MPALLKHDAGLAIIAFVIAVVILVYLLLNKTSLGLKVRSVTQNRPMAAAMGIELLAEEQYRELQKLGEFDLKTSSWVRTPAGIRERGGAVFCDRRYDTVFLYHNGADSYYAARGFRGLLHL